MPLCVFGATASVASKEQRGKRAPKPRVPSKSGGWTREEKRRNADDSNANGDKGRKPSHGRLQKKKKVDDRRGLRADGRNPLSDQGMEQESKQESSRDQGYRGHTASRHCQKDP